MLFGLKHETVNAKIVRIHELLIRSGALKKAPKNPQQFTQATHDAVVYFQQTHLGQNGKPLGVDGVVGGKTFWALRHNKGKAQKSNIKPRIPGGLPENRRAVLKVALAEHARPAVERPNGSNRGPVVDKYLQPAWWRRNPKGPPWCCLFYSWIVDEALGEFPIGARQASCFRAREMAKKAGLWIEGGGGPPVPGDAFVMLYRDAKGRLTGKGHIGFVLRVSNDGMRINTVEGNCGNRVKVGTRDTSTIAGYIMPGHDTEPFMFTHGLNRAAKVDAEGTR